MSHPLRLATLAFALVSTTAATQVAAQTTEEIDELARDVSRLEALRSVKDIQRTYAQYAQYGLWLEMAELFSDNSRIAWGDEIIEGRTDIAAWLGGRSGPVSQPGGVNTELIDDPLINLSVDGRSAQGRWRGLALRGDGKGRAWMEGGIYENRYLLENGTWKIAALNYHPEFEGEYETGWSNVGQRNLPIVPYHFTVEQVGIPIPQPQGKAPSSGTNLQSLFDRVSDLNDEDDVRNLQHAYGYYVARRMWSDVVDLFTDDSAIEFSGKIYRGKRGVREVMSLMGPEHLSHGIINDYLPFDTIVEVKPGGQVAFTRGTELAMIGDAGAGTARWKINVFRNRLVKENGLWKVREMRIASIMDVDYAKGWGSPDMRSGPIALPEMPAFLGPSGSKRRGTSTRFKITGRNALTGKAPPSTRAAATDLSDIRRRLLRSAAWDGTQNVSAAYGYCLDDFQWPCMSGIFAEKGNKQSPFAGYYFGRDRIAGAATAMYGKTPDPATVTREKIAYHWRIAPVINASHDGRSTLLRTYLFHPNTAKYDAAGGGPNKGNTIQSGMYPNDQVVLEDGSWKLWTLTIDEPYMMMPSWQGGWSAATPPPAGGGMRASPLLQRYPPDLLLTKLGKREEGFAGGTGTKIDWPGILPMWFHYRNPVSGRVPPLFWPDCVPCEVRPDVRLTANGYQMPPSGPSTDGIEIAPSLTFPPAKR